MSHGPGKIERKIAELFAASGPYIMDVVDAEGEFPPGADRAFTVDELVAEVFGARKLTLAQRGSVLRAAHRVIARAKAKSKYGPLSEWRASPAPGSSRRIVFHHVSRPVRVWAVAIRPAGLVWADATIRSISADRVNVTYAGDKASLNRGALAFEGAWWRGVMFLSDRSGYGAAAAYERWLRRYGRLPENVGLMPLEEARRLLGVAENYTRADILAGFRAAAKRCHPDVGGTEEQFHALVKARDRLLASLGMKAAPPTPPAFYPAGVKVIYRRAGASGPPRLAGGVKRIGKA
jgi:DnaJ homolog subfamily C member 19